MARSLRALAPSLALLAGAAGFSLCAFTYGKGIYGAPSAREAAPFAAPFLLCAAAAGASLAIAGAAACDAAEKISRS